MVEGVSVLTQPAAEQSIRWIDVMKPKCLSINFTSRFIVVLCLLSLLLPSSVAAENSLAGKKNVLILLADDLGWGDVSFHGGKAATPNIAKLAEQGVRLNRFYAFPACSPARAAMLTGRFPQRYGISGPVRPRDEGLPVDETVLAAAFQKEGYQTSLIGKWHLGQSSVRGAHPTQRGFDHFYGFMDASIDYYKHTGGRGSADWQRDGQQISEEGYSTDLLSAEAVRQIRGSNKRTPFCIVVSFNAPHTPFQAPENLISNYRSMNRNDATYAAMIESMDIGIGKMLDAIDDKNLVDDTIVVFASDNGAGRGGVNLPFRGKKREVYEGGIHVPCVIRLPGIIKAGSQSEQLTAIHDLFPTVAAACGISTKSVTRRPLDGQNLWNSFTGGGNVDRSLVIAESDYAMFQNDWKLIESAEGTHELYNLKQDPTESQDQAKQQAQILRTMKMQLATFKQQVAADRPASDSFSLPTVKTSTANGSVAQQFTPEAIKTAEGGDLAAAKIQGDAIFGTLGDPRIESNGLGIQLLAGVDDNKDKQRAAEVTLSSTDVNANQRWYRFYISGMAQENFAVAKDDLYLKVEFFNNNGTRSLDMIKERIYGKVVRERKDLKDDATNASLGHGTWRTYAMDFRTPFPEIDKIDLSVGFREGTATGKRTGFWIRSMNLEAIDAPASYQPKANVGLILPQPSIDSLVHLGGRWYFNPQGQSRSLPKQFDHTNADQLLYQSDRFEAPFAGNMTSWLRKGYLDLNDKTVEQDQYRPDAVVVTVTKEHLVINSRNLPNHPTATFPDRWRMLDGNPAYIKEQANVWKLPLVPTVNKNHIAMTAKNENQALPMGPIGVATNGVVFFNPFDHIFETDAVWRLDRCCGHPSPRYQYHYHKYPVCVKTPWSDEGQQHSSVIGFAFDGFPVYGPYEAKGLLARDDSANPLNDFNLHEDSKRGAHYHVTPGKFPHLIGGYWGVAPERGRRPR